MLAFAGSHRTLQETNVSVARESVVDYSKMSNAEFRAMMLKKKSSMMAYLKGQQAKQIAFKDRIRDSGYGLALERYDEDDQLISLWVCSGYSKGELKRGLDDDTLVYPRWLPFSEAKAIWNALQINWDNKIQKAEIEFDERMMVLRDKDGRLIDRSALRAKIAEERENAGQSDMSRLKPDMNKVITIVPASVAREQEEKSKDAASEEHQQASGRRSRRRANK